MCGCFDRRTWPNPAIIGVFSVPDRKFRSCGVLSFPKNQTKKKKKNNQQSQKTTTQYIYIYIYTHTHTQIYILICIFEDFIMGDGIFFLTWPPPMNMGFNLQPLRKYSAPMRGP